MYPLNEAFASSIIQKMWSQPYGKDALMKLRNAFKDLDINRISDSDIQYLQPKDAFKINVDGLKFWINAGKIVGVTRSNSCFDRYFEVKRSKRGQIVDMDPAFLEMYSQSRKTWDGVVGCYVLDVNAAIRNGASVKGVERKRKEARTGALALKTNREIKQENIARYIKLLKDRGFSDGTEFALISNVNKLLLDHCKKVGATHFFIYDLVGSTFLLNYLQSYSNTLVEYIELLDKNGYILPTNVNADDYVDENDNDRQKLSSIRETLKKSVDDVKRELNRSVRHNVKDAADAIVKNTKEIQDFKQLISGARGYNESSYKVIMDFVFYLENNLYSAIANPQIGSYIMNFDMFLLQLNGIYEQLRNNDQIRKIQDVLEMIEYYVTKKPTDVKSEDIYIRMASINSSILKRVENYILMIRKI